jgi:2-keto-4-pentenoate hydratase
MSFTPDQVAQALIQARLTQTQIAPLSTQFPTLGLVDAYKVSKFVSDTRKATGDRLVGKKIGLTSRAVQAQLGVHEPDYGYLFSSMEVAHRGVLAPRSLMQGKAEGEVAFRLGGALTRPGVRPEDVIAATEYVQVCIEIIDTRIENWKIKIADTIADNASSAFFVLGPEKRKLTETDLRLAGMSLYRNGELESTGVGAACLDHPVLAVAWLANKMIELGEPLQAGDLVLSGAYGPVVPFNPGDQVRVAISGLGEVEASYGV